MFNKLKSFSEDVAKSFTDISQNDTRKTSEVFNQLRDSEKILQVKTPDASELSPPENTPEDTETKGSSANVVSGNQTGSETADTSESNVSTGKASQKPLANVNMDDLPPLVRSKLRKFAKYEEKYPVLLDAYKTEKKKTLLIQDFEKTLLENTPIQSVSDVALLGDYLKGLTEKNNLLEKELKLSNNEKNKLLKINQEISKKATDNEKALKYSEETINKQSKEEEALKAQIKDQDGHLKESREFSDKFIAELNTKLAATRESQKEESDNTSTPEKILAIDKDVITIKALKGGPDALGKIEKKLLAGSLYDVSQVKDSDKMKKVVEKVDDNAIKLKIELYKKTRELDDRSNQLEYKSKESEEKSKKLKNQSEQLNKMSKELDDITIKYEKKSNELDEKTKELDDLKKGRNVTDTYFEENAAEKKDSNPTQDELGEAMESGTVASSSELTKYQGMFESMKTENAKQEHKILTLEGEIQQLIGEKEGLQEDLMANKEEVAKLKKELLSAPSSNSSSETKDNAEDPLEHNATFLKERDSKKKKKRQSKDVGENKAAAIVEAPNKAKKEVLESKVPELEAKLEASEKEKIELWNQFSESKQELSKKSEDLDTLRDLLRDMGIELVSVKDKLKACGQECFQRENANEYNKSEADLQTQLNKNRDELDRKSKELEQLREKCHAITTEFEKAKSDLKIARSKLEKVDSDCKKSKSDLEKARSELVQTKSDLDKSNSKYEKINSDLRKTSSELEGSKSNITSLRNELASTNKLLEKEKEKTSFSVLKQKEEQEKSKAALNDLNKKLATVINDLDVSNREKESLEEEKKLLNTRVDELLQFRRTDSSLKLEMASLQSSISHKDEQIRELNSTINAKGRERDEMNSEIAKLKATTKELQVSNTNLVAERTATQRKADEAAQRSAVLAAELSKLQVNKQEVSTELDGLKLKYDSLLKSRSSSSGEIQALRQQYDELSMRSKENQKKIDILEEELSDAQRMLQDRMREGAVMRRMLSESKEEYELKYSGIKSELRAANEEKSSLLSDLQSVRKRTLREIEELTAETDNYSKKIAVLQRENEELVQQMVTLSKSQKSNSPEDLQKQKDMESTVNELHNSLQRASEKSREYESLNQILKKLNDESNSKFERLTKNYKLITQQYRMIKEQNEKISSSTASQKLLVEEVDAPPSANVAYLKIVLIGFLEHKGQREQLLPVLSLLFQLDSAEEKKLMAALN